ncbi:2Fe-2S iron-sulfur cluster-binding protein [Nafulsella turpanensis]|uniref:2Fe-2S iron-sulfur cluster-binding protein n=1 Tax=Nafulsella turpanensis TaxID=1265690 RepID=UPI0003463C03|nr:2Fe-2S iron-sulfur cluster-binding protein [Nafulsella turpanensis]
MIRFKVEDREGNVQDIEVPADISLSLMEVLKASEYNILATCGGMALCATCHIEVEEGVEELGEPSDAELDMLDTLPIVTSNSRLACQIRIGEHLNGAYFKLMAEEES